MRTPNSIWCVAALGAAAVFALPACDKSSGAGGASSSSAAVTSSSAPVASSSTVASGSAAAPSASASAGGSVAGACAALAKDKAAYCDRLAGGDPTVKMTCQEGIDALVKAGDDAKCKAATAPSTKKPSDDPDPD